VSSNAVRNIYKIRKRASWKTLSTDFAKFSPFVVDTKRHYNVSVLGYLMNGLSEEW